MVLSDRRDINISDGPWSSFSGVWDILRSSNLRNGVSLLQYFFSARQILDLRGSLSRNELNIDDFNSIFNCWMRYWLLFLVMTYNWFVCHSVQQKFTASFLVLLFFIFPMCFLGRYSSRGTIPFSNWRILNIGCLFSVGASSTVLFSQCMVQNDYFGRWVDG